METSPRWGYVELNKNEEIVDSWRAPKNLKPGTFKAKLRIQLYRIFEYLFLRDWRNSVNW